MMITHSCRVTQLRLALARTVRTMASVVLRPVIHVGSDVPELESNAIFASTKLYENVLSEDEESKLVSFLDGEVSRRKYESGHWDQVIEGYRESSIGPVESFPSELHSCLQGIISRLPLSPNERLLPLHALDLQRDGFIAAHVDSVKFSGGILAGLSLLSPSVMRLRPAQLVDSNPQLAAASRRYVDLLLPRRSLYVLTGAARYEWTHEIAAAVCVFASGRPMPLALDGKAAAVAAAEAARGVAGAVIVPRYRRLSLLFRDEIAARRHRTVCAGGGCLRTSDTERKATMSRKRQLQTRARQQASMWKT